LQEPWQFERFSFFKILECSPARQVSFLIYVFEFHIGKKKRYWHYWSHFKSGITYRWFTETITSPSLGVVSASSLIVLRITEDTPCPFIENSGSGTLNVLSTVSSYLMYEKKDASLGERRYGDTKIGH
jgi:hypothetical protein